MANPYPITPRQLDLVNLSGSHLIQQGVYPDIKMGVVSSYNVAGASAETVLKSTASGGITLDSLNVQGNSILRNVLPENPDTYDLGSSINLWRKGWLSELDSVLFAQNTVTLLGGWLMISKNEGSLATDVLSTDTLIDFGQSMTIADYVVLRSSLQVEYIQVGVVDSGTTYNVVRDLDGSGANDWTSGTPFVVLGNTGDGRIELNAYDTPRIQMIQQGATYNQQKEIIRIGDLNGNWNYSSEEWGVAIGAYGSGSSNVTIDSINGVRINIYDVPIMEFKSTGAFISNVLNMSGSVAAIAIGATPPSGSGVGTGLWLSKDGLFSLASNIYQVKIDAANGKLYAGGGAVVVDTDGVKIQESDSLFVPKNAVTWLKYGDDSTEVGGIGIYKHDDDSTDEMLINVVGGGRADAITILAGYPSPEYDAAFIRLQNNSAGNTPLIDMNADNVRISSALTVSGDIQVYRSVPNATYAGYILIPLTSPLTSTSWDGDAFSTTAKTLIDLSAVFGAPAGIKAVDVMVNVRDSASQTSDTILTLSPNNTSNSGIRFAPAYVNDRYGRGFATINCDANGDIYYQIAASGSSTFDAIIQIWGYHI